MSSSVTERPAVPADLIEATPERNGLLEWILASPMIVFLLWAWVDLFAWLSPIPWYWLDALVGTAVFALLIVLPLGLVTHWIVTAIPSVFQRAGWELQFLEPVDEAKVPFTRWEIRTYRRAPTSWARLWLRAAQGWVWLEMATILVGGIVMIPLFFNAVEFGFGR